VPEIDGLHVSPLFVSPCRAWAAPLKVRRPRLDGRNSTRNTTINIHQMYNRHHLVNVDGQLFFVWSRSTGTAVRYPARKTKKNAREIVGDVAILVHRYTSQYPDASIKNQCICTVV
jgi:hypothetical protein